MQGLSWTRLLVVVVGLGCWVGADPAPAAADPGDAVGDTAVALVEVEGGAFDLLETVATHQATVLVWYSSSCPCVSRYEERFEALRGTWPEGQVAMIGVASNADDDADRVRQELAARPFPLPVVLDPGGQLAGELGVFSTPTVVLLDAEGTVRYQGWMDNEEDLGDEDREAYLEEALNALLAGSDDAPTGSPVYGCTVTRSL